MVHNASTGTSRRWEWWNRLAKRLQGAGLWVELTRNLASRDVETRYKHSLLGLYWAIINPLVTAAIFGFVFGVIFHVSTKPIPYVVFYLGGLTFWNFFANGVMSAVGSVSGNAALLAKIYFPRIVLPTAAVLARFIDFLFSFGVLVVFILLYRVPVHWTSLWIPLILLLQMFFTLGIGYMVAALNVLYRDVTQLMGLLLMVWLYFSPVMYRVSGHPKSLQIILLINPVGTMIEVERNVIFTGQVLHPEYLWAAIAWTGFVFLGGIALFKRVEPLFAEVM
ncbi:MAG: ABC transporter permease [Sulfobacillus benefaciens]|uniref:Transport permease protein n=1 Tax=Sulfobacillus benefaciens TaxID=453960 RepID=A0A2T2XIP4_9FIRM|nr:MAG: ABC transporter permease [Sulfobacillus benefaciens]